MSPAAELGRQVRTAFVSDHETMQYMIVEHFRDGPAPVYARFREQGRLAPTGLRYVSSWVTADGTRCYQLMECDERGLLDAWIRAWQDLVEFEVIPVISSAEAADRFGPRRSEPPNDR
jgi:hypothetical protein